MLDPAATPDVTNHTIIPAAPLSNYEKILKCFRSGPMSIDRLVELTGIPKQLIRDVISKLHRNGTIIPDGIHEPQSHRSHGLFARSTHLFRLNPDPQPAVPVLISTDQRAVFKAFQQGATSVDQVASFTGIPRSTVLSIARELCHTKPPKLNIVKPLKHDRYSVLTHSERDEMYDHFFKVPKRYLTSLLKPAANQPAVVILPNGTLSRRRSTPTAKPVKTLTPPREHHPLPPRPSRLLRSRVKPTSVT